MLDKATSIRPGEEFDVSALTTYLREHWPGFEVINDIHQFPGGYSNLTYLLVTNLGEFVLRRPPVGANIQSAHDMSREFKVLSLLNPVYEKSPKPILHCEDTSVIGAPYFIMERVNGIILRGHTISEVSPSADEMHALSIATIDNMVALHQLDIRHSRLLELGKPEGYVARQIGGWIDRYYKSATDVIENMDRVTQWLQLNEPADGIPALIHNDYKYDNLVLSPDNLAQIEAVLDWEMATIGDPLMDLGTTLAYWCEPYEAKALPLAAAIPTWLPGNLNREELVARYAVRSGRDVSNILFYYVYGTFKVAVIVQQIYARYKKGLTQDPRFAGLIDAVHFFANQAVKAIEARRISNL
ncbi:MAG: phosphotransferase family protein [Saprospiraceae bacterium]|nr:phosphotransferase family protein [Saprospiraceae bacterium]